MQNLSKYYVYGLYKNNTELFYIGKGSGSRYKHYYKKALRQNRYLTCHLKYLIKENISYVGKIIKDNLTEDEALNYEAELIKQYGKKVNGTGCLYNIADGGNQPPSVFLTRQIKGEKEFKNIIEKQKKTFKEKIYQRNKNDIETLKKLLNEGKMLNDISKIIGKTTNTLRSWIRKHELKMNYEGKQKFIKDHLHNLRKKNNLKAAKTSKTYTVQEPNGNVIVTNKLVVYCKTKKIDYANLRKTETGKSKQAYGYRILEVKEPIQKEKSSFCN